MKRFVLIAAALSTVLALGGALAHAYELLNKMPLPLEEYFIVQKAYRGWNSFSFILSIEMTSMIACLVLFWKDRLVRWCFAVALAMLIGSQAVFWAFTFPTNLATEQWTQIPENADALRAQWEYSHLAGAAMQLCAFTAILWALVARFDRRPSCG